MNLIKDYQTGKNNIISMSILVNYRFGNWVFYRVKLPILRQLLLIIYKVWYFVIRLVTSCEIPAQAKIGGGVTLEHGGKGIVIHGETVIGENVRIFHYVTIGWNGYFEGDEGGTPVIGANVFIGAGSKVLGKIKLGDRVKIGANAVVLKDVPSNCTAVGIPAKILNAS